MKKALTFITNLLFAFSVNAQEELPVNISKIVFTTSVFEYIPIPINMGNINIGTDIYIGNGFSLYTNLGFLKSYGPTKEDILTNYAEHAIGGRMQFEVRKYLNKHNIKPSAFPFLWIHNFQIYTQKLLNSGYYFAFGSTYEYLILDRKEIVPYYYASSPLPYSIVHNTYNVNKSKFLPNMRIGYQSIKKSNFTIDHAIGVGVHV